MPRIALAASVTPEARRRCAAFGGGSPVRFRLRGRAVPRADLWGLPDATPAERFAAATGLGLSALANRLSERRRVRLPGPKGAVASGLHDLSRVPLAARSGRARSYVDAADGLARAAADL
ncbi:MAG: hypothetical protein ACU0BS_08840 [Hasllibacter sp.]